MATSPQDGLDPTGAQTPEAFMQLLSQARTASGLSLVEIAERARQRGYDLDPAELARALASPTLPNWQTVTGVLTACGLGGMQIDRWIRVYHDLADPVPPVAPAAPATAVLEPVDDVAPISVPPLVLTTASATPARFGRRHYAIGAGLLAGLIVAPLLLLTVLNGQPDTVAAQVPSSAPRTSDAAPLVPSPSDVPVALPSPTDVAAPTSPAPATTTKSPPRTSAPPPPPQSPAPPSPAPPSPADPGVLRSGVVTLTGDGGFDLDSGQTDGERDIYRWNRDTLATANGSLLESVSGMPTKQGCQSQRDWRAWAGDLRVGQWLCVRTSDGRYGRLNITGVGGELKVAYTVWN